ncbi:DUF5819 family protein [Streptomyces sp. NPDC086023]|uniref:DUF5819 family protein n=1 Tax=Streptomyces sp. NPDC086023 TaxID=3365746 RepID=UPI0037D0981A
MDANEGGGRGAPAGQSGPVVTAAGAAEALGAEVPGAEVPAEVSETGEADGAAGEVPDEAERAAGEVVGESGGARGEVPGGLRGVAGPEAVRAPGIAGLSLPYRSLAALALGAVVVTACWHLAMVFLHVAPANTVSRKHAEAVDEWIYPEFEQNWKLFAPNPLQQNIAVQVRAELRTPSGERVTTGWRDLSAEDGAEIRHNPLPSHVHQNELRRAWDFFTGSHDDQNRANGERGRLSEAYLRRIAMQRLHERRPAGVVERVQLRSATRAVAAPPYSDEKTDTQVYYRELPWWNVTAADLPATAAGAQREETAP